MHTNELSTRITQLLEPAVRLVAHEIVAEINKRLQESSSLRTTESDSEWMTITELARYWKLCNSAGQATTAGITKWVNRCSEDFPLPSSRMGDLLRFNRAKVDRWAEEEGERHRAAKSRRAIKLIK